jgi:hypothetical protein
LKLPAAPPLPGGSYLHCSWTLSTPSHSGSQLPRQDTTRRPGEGAGRAGLGKPGSHQSLHCPHSLSVHSPCLLQLEEPQSSSLQAAPRQKLPEHSQRPSTQVPWPLQSGGWQRGSCTHTTVDTWRGQRHMLSWLQGRRRVCRGSGVLLILIPPPQGLCMYCALCPEGSLIPTQPPHRSISALLPLFSVRSFLTHGLIHRCGQSWHAENRGLGSFAHS